MKIGGVKLPWKVARAAKVLCRWVGTGSIVNDKIKLKQEVDRDDFERLVTLIDGYSGVYDCTKPIWIFFLQEVFAAIIPCIIIGGWSFLFVAFLPIASLITFVYTHTFWDEITLFLSLLMAGFSVLGYMLRPEVEKRMNNRNIMEMYVKGQLSLEEFDQRFRELHKLPKSQND